MSLITINIDSGYFSDRLGTAKAALVPEAVVRDAESNLERFLVNHSEAFWGDLDAAIEKAIDENHSLLVEAGAVDGDEEDGEESGTGVSNAD